MNKTHARLATLSSRDNQLLIAERTVKELVTIIGQTPCYVYDRAELTARVAFWRQQMPNTLKLHYAMKANPMPAVVSHMATLVDGLDVASHQEMLVALSSGMKAEHISFAGPTKRLPELIAATQAGVTINVESLHQLQQLYRCADELGVRPRIAFRVNPDFELKASGMKMAGGAKQFGIDAELLPNILRTLDTNRVNLQGFHIFTGSQNLRAESLIEAHQKVFELAATLAEYAPVPIQHVNIGGGLGIPYFANEATLELGEITDNLNHLLANRPAVLQQAEFIMELGRYLVGEAGYYICQVVDKKQSRGQTFVMTNGGLHHHLANSGNFGQVLRKNYPVVLAHCLTCEESALEQVEIVGPLCTPLDIVAAKINLPPINIDDYIVVLQSGAYGKSASPTQFLSHPDAVEFLL